MLGVSYEAHTYIHGTDFLTEKTNLDHYIHIFRKCINYVMIFVI